MRQTSAYKARIVILNMNKDKQRAMVQLSQDIKYCRQVGDLQLALTYIEEMRAWNQLASIDTPVYFGGCWLTSAQYTQCLNWIEQLKDCDLYAKHGWQFVEDAKTMERIEAIEQWERDTGLDYYSTFPHNNTQH